MHVSGLRIKRFNTPAWSVSRGGRLRAGFILFAARFKPGPGPMRPRAALSWAPWGSAGRVSWRLGGLPARRCEFGLSAGSAAFGLTGCSKPHALAAGKSPAPVAAGLLVKRRARETPALPQPSWASLHLPSPGHNQKGRGRGRRVWLELRREGSNWKMGSSEKRHSRGCQGRTGRSSCLLNVW